MTVCCMVPPYAPRVTVCMAWARSGGVALVFVVHVDQLQYVASYHNLNETPKLQKTIWERDGFG